MQSDTWKEIPEQFCPIGERMCRGCKREWREHRIRSVGWKGHRLWEFLAHSPSDASLPPQLFAILFPWPGGIPIPTAGTSRYLTSLNSSCHCQSPKVYILILLFSDELSHSRLASNSLCREDHPELLILPSHLLSSANKGIHQHAWITLIFSKGV